MKLLSFFADLIFPPHCMICHRLIDPDEKPVCAACLDKLPAFDGAAPKVRFADRVCVSFYYEDTLRESFLRYKFADRREYAAQYGKWMCVTIGDRLQGGFDVITYVPVSARRRRERGYDQAELLCREIAKTRCIPMQPLLCKRRHTKPQSGLRQREERAANASDAYAAIHTEWIAGKRILLIDDIITTGATMSECCRVLSTAGAASVSAAALATPREEAER